MAQAAKLPRPRIPPTSSPAGAPSPVALPTAATTIPAPPSTTAVSLAATAAFAAAVLAFWRCSALTSVMSLFHSFHRTRLWGFIDSTCRRTTISAVPTIWRESLAETSSCSTGRTRVKSTVRWAHPGLDSSLKMGSAERDPGLSGGAIPIAEPHRSSLSPAPADADHPDRTTPLTRYEPAARRQSPPRRPANWTLQTRRTASATGRRRGRAKELFVRSHKNVRGSSKSGRRARTRSSAPGVTSISCPALTAVARLSVFEAVDGLRWLDAVRHVGLGGWRGAGRRLRWPPFPDGPAPARWMLR